MLKITIFVKICKRFPIYGDSNVDNPLSFIYATGTEGEIEAVEFEDAKAKDQYYSQLACDDGESVCLLVSHFSF